MPTAETQHRTAEEARVLEEIRKALKWGRAEVLFTIRRGRVVQCRATRVEEWEQEDN